MPEGISPEPENQKEGNWFARAINSFKSHEPVPGTPAHQESAAELSAQQEKNKSEVDAASAERAAAIDATTDEHMVVPKPSDTLVELNRPSDAPIAEMPTPIDGQFAEAKSDTPEAPDELDKAA